MQAGWADEAGAWATRELARAGRRVAGPIESVHARIWSTVLRIPTAAGDGGDVFLKACGPAGAHEPALLRFLAGRWPERVPRVIAVDISRGWVLMADAGREQLRETIARHRDLSHWRTILPLYAQMQIELAGDVDELAALGVPDERVETLADKLAALLEQIEFLHRDQPGGLRSGDHTRLRAALPRVREACEKLLAQSIPQTLSHGDLHDGNIFVVARCPSARCVIFDWGDSSITHPFFTLRTTAASIERTLGLALESKEWLHLRDAYLEPWTRFASRDAVRVAAELAGKLAPLEGALRWYHVLAAVPAELRADWREPIPRLMEDLLAAFV
jgi:Phosphotransferase enzyme family